MVHVELAWLDQEEAPHVVSDFGGEGEESVRQGHPRLLDMIIYRPREMAEPVHKTCVLGLSGRYVQLWTKRLMLEPGLLYLLRF